MAQHHTRVMETQLSYKDPARVHTADKLLSWATETSQPLLCASALGAQQPAVIPWHFKTINYTAVMGTILSNGNCFLPALKEVKPGPGQLPLPSVYRRAGSASCCRWLLIGSTSASPREPLGLAGVFQPPGHLGEEASPGSQHPQSLPCLSLPAVLWQQAGAGKRLQELVCVQCDRPWDGLRSAKEMQTPPS